jgi:hypothetical protein
MAMPQPTPRLPRLAEEMSLLLLERIDVMLAGDLLDQSFRRVESQFSAHGTLT